jgi:hypothetical protein
MPTIRLEFERRLRVVLRRRRWEANGHRGPASSAASEQRRSIDRIERRKAGALAGAGLVLSLVALASPGGAAQQDPRAALLGSAKTLTCTFQQVATARWTNGALQTQMKPANLRLAFKSINVDEGTAGLVGQFGRSEIIAKFTGSTLHLIESFRDGPLYITTVFAKESTPGRLQAVHARHEYADVVLPGFTSSPEQYYGDCEVGRE